MPEPRAEGAPAAFAGACFTGGLFIAPPLPRFEATGLMLARSRRLSSAFVLEPLFVAFGTAIDDLR